MKRLGSMLLPLKAVLAAATLVVMASAALTGAAHASTTETAPLPAPETSPDTETEPTIDNGFSDQIQILGVDEAGDEVALDLAVPPAIGRLAPVADNFGVTDGGVLVEVSVAPVETAVDTVMVLDTSGSMRGSALAAAKAAAVSFIEALPPDAKVALIGFGETVVTYRSPTLDRAGLLTDLEDLRADGNQTVLWDALLVASDMVGGLEADHSSVVVLSDGDDTASAAIPSDVVGSFGSASTILYAVAIESPDTDLLALEETVDRVGGQFLATTDVAQLESLYTEIAARLANRYRLRFSPAQEGQRTVVVSVAADGTVATARTVIGHGNGQDTGGGAGDGASVPGETNPKAPAVLNTESQPVLGAVPTPSPGPLTGPAMLGVGLASVFAAFAILGLIVARPAAQVRLDAATGVDRVGGINARLGEAANELISRHDRTSRIDTRLEAADVKLRPGEFVVAWLFVTAVAALAVLALAGVALAALTVVGSAVVVFGVLGVRAKRRSSRFADQLTETLGIMAGSLRAGQSLAKSIELVAAEAASPTAEEFHRISFEVRVGRDLTESISDAARRTASADVAWLAQAVDINRELGGDLSEIMDNVATTIRERRTVARQIDALSAEGRASAWVLIAMPIILFLFSWWRTPESVEILMTEPLGQVLLIVAVSGMAAGAVWIRHLVQLKY